MKIEINDMVLNDTLLDLMDEVIRVRMKDIIDQGPSSSLPEDQRDYTKLQLAAKVIHNYFSLSEDHYVL